jgi:hypothetical protein
MNGAHITVREYFAGLFAAAMVSDQANHPGSIAWRAVALSDSLLLELRRTATSDSGEPQ